MTKDHWVCKTLSHNEKVDALKTIEMFLIWPALLGEKIRKILEKKQG